MPSVSTPLILLAAVATIPALVFVTWVGLLFHRVLNLPADQQKHGMMVLKQLTQLVRVGATHKNTETRPSRPRPALPKNSRDVAGSE